MPRLFAPPPRSATLRTARAECAGCCEELMGEQQDLFDKQPPPWELDDQRERCVGAVVFSEMPFGPYDYEVPDATA